MVWVSHKHGDHILGVPSLLALRGSSAPPLLLLGPSALHAWLTECFPSLHARFSFALASLFKAPTPQRFGRAGAGAGAGRGAAGTQPRAAPCGCVGLDMFPLRQASADGAGSVPHSSHFISCTRKPPRYFANPDSQPRHACCLPSYRHLTP
jgi:hypothetical protein